MSVLGFVEFLKGKSSLMIYQKRGNMKFKYRNRQFWCRGFYVDTVGKNTERIKEYIRNQLKEDAEQMQLAIEFPDDPLKNGYIVVLKASVISGVDALPSPHGSDGE